MNVTAKNNFPINTFSNFSSAPRDFNRINMVKNGMPHYQLNSTGRDTYIFNNNGGFAAPYETAKYAKPGRMVSHMAFIGTRDKFPELVGRPVRYNQDGTGRDTYILSTHGGFEKEARQSGDF